MNNAMRAVIELWRWTVRFAIRLVIIFKQVWNFETVMNKYATGELVSWFRVVLFSIHTCNCRAIVSWECSQNLAVIASTIL